MLCPVAESSCAACTVVCILEERRGRTVARPGPIVRDDDPWTSHVAAERIEPKRETRRWRVLAKLRDADGGWVSGVEITAPDVGGSEGLRRLRELRNGGWPIERRPSPDSSTAWEYRLAVSAR